MITEILRLLHWDSFRVSFRSILLDHIRIKSLLLLQKTKQVSPCISGITRQVFLIKLCLFLNKKR